MEFFLVKNAAVDFRGPSTETGDGESKWTRTSNLISVAACAVVKDRVRPAETYLQKFETALIENNCVFKDLGDGDDNGHCISMNLRVSLTLSTNESDSCSIAIWHDPKDGKGASIVTRIQDVFGEEHVKVTVAFKKLRATGWDSEPFAFELKDLQISELSTKNGGCKFDQGRFPSVFLNPWMNGLNFRGKISIIASLDHEATSSLYLETYFKSSLVKRSRMILTEEACSDMVIVSGTGEEIKCHKAFLSVSSAVFKAMFESEMIEATKNTLDMPDMSSDGVRAFLAFIYHWDLREASKSMGIAVELLRAAHKYGISEMETAMQDIICAKPMEWFNVDETLKLLMFAKNLDEESGRDKLKGKTICVLKWFTSTSRDNIVNSQEFQKLFEEHPQAALEFCIMIMETS